MTIIFVYLYNVVLTISICKNTIATIEYLKIFRYI